MHWVDSVLKAALLWVLRDAIFGRLFDRICGLALRTRDKTREDVGFFASGYRDEEIDNVDDEPREEATDDSIGDRVS